MAGFRKPKPQQADLKIGMYGLAGSGKTATALLFAEGLAKREGKSVAFIDTEHGTDFYVLPVPERTWHPKAFDFDVIYTKSVTEVRDAVTTIDTKKYAVCVIDSITHVWAACIEAYSGRKTSADTIPMHAWGKIKKPYKDIMQAMINLPIHMIICGRLGGEYGTDEDTGEMIKIRDKMKAEGETPYEPHMLIQMRKSQKDPGNVEAWFEKDRSGLFTGKTFPNPTFEILTPVLQLLGKEQAQMETTDAYAAQDSEKMAEEEREREKKSLELREHFVAMFTLCCSKPELEKRGKELTAEIKSKMIKDDLAVVREKFLTEMEKYRN